VQAEGGKYFSLSPDNFDNEVRKMQKSNDEWELVG